MWIVDAPNPTPRQPALDISFKLGWYLIQTWLVFVVAVVTAPAAAAAHLRPSPAVNLFPARSQAYRKTGWQRQLARQHTRHNTRADANEPHPRPAGPRAFSDGRLLQRPSTAGLFSPQLQQPRLLGKLGNSFPGHTTRAPTARKRFLRSGRVRTCDQRHPVVCLCQLG